MAECVASMADGSRGGGATCMWFGTGAVGGAVPADGLFCACAEFRSGADCASLDPAAFLPASVFLLLIALCAWLVVFAQRVRREIVQFQKQGNGEPLRALRIVQAGTVLTGLTLLIEFFMLVSPLPYGALWVAFDIFNSFIFGCYLALAAYMAIIFRVVTRSAEGRASTAVRDTRIAHAYLVSATVFMFATSRTRFRSIMFLILALLVMLPCVRSAVAVSRLMHEAQTLVRDSVSGNEIGDALGRIRRTLRHWALIFVCFVAVRVCLVLTSQSLAPVQETVWYELRQLTRWISYLNGLHYMVVVVQYLAGPARSASRRISSKTLRSSPSARVAAAPQPGNHSEAAHLQRSTSVPSSQAAAASRAQP